MQKLQKKHNSPYKNPDKKSDSADQRGDELKAAGDRKGGGVKQAVFDVNLFSPWCRNS